jgi:hypothetical protein
MVYSPTELIARGFSGLPSEGFARAEQNLQDFPELANELGQPVF